MLLRHVLLSLFVAAILVLDVENNDSYSDCCFVSAGTPEDKLRLFIINLICGSPMTDVCPSSI